MGWLGLARDGMGSHQQEPWLHLGLAAIRRASRSVSGQSGGPCVQRNLGRPISEWGWRIPFLLSIIMVGIGLWIRLGILETPVFRKVLAEERVVRAPVWE